MLNPTRHLRLATFMLFVVGVAGFVEAKPPAGNEGVAQLKAHLAASQAALRHYTWIETTSVVVNGAEKSNKQMSCYYGADGKLQKVEVAASAAPRQKPGLRGAIAANKKEEMTAYMQSAVALVKTYLPLDPNAIQATATAGRVSVDILQPGRRERLNFRSYHKPGDNLAVEFDLVAKRPLAVSVSTYLADPKDAVTLSTGMGTLDDGSTYVANITLSAPAKNIQVSVQNSGYRKLK